MLAHQIQLTYKTNMMLTGEKKNMLFPKIKEKSIFSLIMFIQFYIERSNKDNRARKVKKKRHSDWNRRNKAIYFSKGHDLAYKT